MRHPHRSFISFILISIGTIVAVASIPRGYRDADKYDTESNSDLEVTPINMLIDNSMSEFDETNIFDKDIQAFMRRWEFKGASFALMYNDSLIYAKGYGDANDTLKCDVSHVFRIASVSKLLTATAVMKLREQKKISLESKVFGASGILNDSMFLDLRTKNLDQITVEHLLRHTSGISTPIGDPAFANYSVAQVIGKELPLTVDDMVYYATQCRLNARPGDRYDYSNLGYIILGKIIEEVTGVEYEQYMRDSILAPIGCHDMFIGHNFSENRAPNEVSYYEVKEADPVEAYDGSGRMTMKSNGGNNVTLLGSAGGWVASPTELLKFVSAINGCSINEDILTEESIKLMTYDSKSDKPIGWATVRGTEWVRSGSMSGTCALVKKQKDGYTWVFITNSSAWIGPNISNYISSTVSRSIAKVKKWPKRDLFQIDTLATEQTER
ncbi:MAG: serine hydrolase domain-containing protein [Rikenellaceae bacterium]